MDEKLKDIQKNLTSIRGKHFNILKNQFIILCSVGFINISITILDNFVKNGFFAQYKQYIFPVTIPIIIFMMALILKKLFFIKKRTEALVSYVDKITNDENKFRSLFEGAIDGHALVHPIKGVIDFNNAFKNLLKLNNQTIFLLESIVHSNYRVDINKTKNFSDFKQQALDNGLAKGYWKIQSFEGEIIPTYIALTKIILDNKNYFMLSIHDETHNEQRQDQLKKITAKAVESTKAKSQFLSNMTHELRTPLNGILGISEDLLLNNEAKSLQEELAIINSSGKTLLSLVNDVLDYSKLEAQKVTLENLPISTQELIRTLNTTFTKTAEKKKLFFDIELDESMPEYFLGDKVRLQQVLINLIGNAIKFTSDGSVKLKIKIENKKNKNNISLGFYVFDSGIGIPQESIGKLFNSFEQVDNTTTRKFGGTGLGLSISSQIVRLFGSTIKVESVESKGSCFSFNFDTKKHIQLNTVEEKADVESIELLPATLIKKILIAEDNKINQIVAQKYFARLGFTNVSVAENGQEALEMTLKNKYDYIFMDMQMPVMDGVKATERIYEEMHFLEAPIIIAMTANNGDEDKSRCENAGMVGFLTKPFDIEEIKKIIIEFEPDKKNAA